MLRRGGVTVRLRGVTVREELIGYVVSIVRKTRNDDSVMVGGGPRAIAAAELAAPAGARRGER